MDGEKTPEIKFLQQAEKDPYFYLDELQFNRDRLKGPVYVVPDPVEWSKKEPAGNPFRFDLAPLSPEPTEWPQNTPRLPNPSRSKRAAVALAAPTDPDTTDGIVKHNTRVTIRCI